MTMPVRLTGRGRGVALVGAGTAAAGAVTGTLVLIAAGAFALTVAALALAWVFLRRSWVQVERATPAAAAFIGQPLTATAELEVGFRDYAPALVHGLAPGGVGVHVARLDREVVAVHGVCTPQWRGLMEWPCIRIELPDPMGIAYALRLSAPTGATVVYPRIEALPAGWIGSVRGAVHAAVGPSSLQGSVGETGPVPRVFQLGDDLRRMHWPATARAGEPMVRVVDGESPRGAVIAIDCASSGYRGADGFERAVSAAASVAAMLLANDWRVSLRTTQGVSLAAERWLAGPVGRELALRTLALLSWDAPSATPRAAPVPGDCLIVLHGSGSSVPEPCDISICTERGSAQQRSAVWDGTGPLAAAWRAAAGAGIR